MGWLVQLEFQLRNNSYFLTIQPDCCGAIATSMAPEPGERDLRCADLADGSLSALPAVLLDIIDYERGRGRWARKEVSR